MMNSDSRDGGINDEDITAPSTKAPRRLCAASRPLAAIAAAARTQSKWGSTTFPGFEALTVVIRRADLFRRTA
jgi:hypothetical protein